MGGVGRKSRSHRETVVGQIVLAGDQKERPLSQYLLSTYRVGGEVPGAPHTPEEMQAFMARVIALEADMDAADAFVRRRTQGPRRSEGCQPQ